MVKSRVLALAMAATLGALPQTSFAFNLGKMLKQAVEGSPQDNQRANLADVPAGKAGTAPAPSQKSGNSLTDNYCRQLFSMAGLDKKAPVDQSLLLDEFKFSAPGDIFDAYTSTTFVPSFAFPSLDFYQGEFETDRANVLFDLVLSYPSAQYVATLIAESRKEASAPQYDHQLKVDAIAALTILHYYLKDHSKTPDRWKQLAARLQAEDHYTAKVITARLLGSGELGPKDPNRALSLANEANDQRGKYSSEQGYRTMSSRNYTKTSNQTIFDVAVRNPNASQARYFTQFVQQYGATLKAPNLPELQSRLDPALKSIEKSSSSALEKASRLVAGAKEVSRLNAQKSSLDNATRNRVSDAPADLNVDNKTAMSITRELAVLTSLNDSQKKQFESALADAHDSGDKAIAMMPVMMSSMMSLMTQRGMGAMPAIIPYAKKFQRHSDNACAVFARWDQAAFVAKATEDNSRSSLASLVAESDK